MKVLFNCLHFYLLLFTFIEIKSNAFASDFVDFIQVFKITNEKELTSNFNTNTFTLVHPRRDVLLSMRRGLFKTFSKKLNRPVMLKAELSSTIRSWYNLESKKIVGEDLSNKNLNCLERYKSIKPLELYISTLANKSEKDCFIKYYGNSLYENANRECLFIYLMEYIADSKDLTKWTKESYAQYNSMESYEKIIRTFMSRIESCLNYLYSHNFIYTDLKGDNVLIDAKKNKSYLIDLESVAKDVLKDDYLLTVAYFPPEKSGASNLRVIYYTYYITIYDALCWNVSGVKYMKEIKCNKRIKNGNVSVKLMNEFKLHLSEYKIPLEFTQILKAFKFKNSETFLTDFKSNYHLPTFKLIYPNDIVEMTKAQRGVFKVYRYGFNKEIVLKFEASNMVRSWFNVNSRTISDKQVTSSTNKSCIGNLAHSVPLEFYVQRQVQSLNESEKFGFVRFYGTNNVTLANGECLFIHQIEFIPNSLDLYQWQKRNIDSFKSSTFQFYEQLVYCRFMQDIRFSLMILYKKFGFIYTDLKPQNVLIDQNTNKAYLIDLESVVLKNKKERMIYTIDYFPPEGITRADDFRILNYTFYMTLFNVMCSNFKTLACTRFTSLPKVPCNRIYTPCVPLIPNSYISQELQNSFNHYLKVLNYNSH